MANEIAELPILSKLPVPLDRDIFMRSLLRELAGTLEDVVGLDEATGFISVVSQRVGEQIHEQYKTALGAEQFSRERLAEILVDLKRRIGADFYIIEHSDEKIVLGNRACPFGEKIVGRPSLCMMTSNVFGVIAADNLGYAKVSVEKAIARGDNGCRVVIYLRASPQAEAAVGREYYQGHKSIDADTIPPVG
jgi:predicted ArsR family transcriptional regulator